MEGNIKRLERQRDYPANPVPDPETVKHWASLWVVSRPVSNDSAVKVYGRINLAMKSGLRGS